MPIFSRSRAGSGAARLSSAPPEAMDASGLSQALLSELRGQRKDFQQTYALIQSRLDKLEKAISRRPRTVDSAQDRRAVSGRSGSDDEETRYVLGDAESMEIIVNLGPLSKGRPLDVQKRLLSPSARRWWQADHADHADGLSLDIAEVEGTPRGVGQPSSETRGVAVGGATRARGSSSSYHWIIGAEGAVREIRDDRAAPSPAAPARLRTPVTTPSPTPVRPPAAKAPLPPFRPPGN